MNPLSVLGVLLLAPATFGQSSPAPALTDLSEDLANNLPQPFQRSVVIQQAQSAPSQNTSKQTKKYADGTVGGDYPAHMAALKRVEEERAARERNTGNPEQVKTKYADGTVGGDYPAHMAALKRAEEENALKKGSTDEVQQTQQSQSASRCFRHVDLASSYQLSDVNNNYPIDAIVAELRANPSMAPMVGFERTNVTNSQTFSAAHTRPPKDLDLSKLSNIKVFPDNFNDKTLASAMAPSERACASQTFLLRAFSIGLAAKRCSVVNPEYQTISYSRCLRRACSQCGCGQGVNACVEHYNWVPIIAYCAHWPVNQRVQLVRLYLPQGCTCNNYVC